MQPFFLHTARRDWRALSCFFLATLAMAAEGAPLIAWTPAQAEAAGVRTLTLAAAPVQPSAGLVLQGQVELPPQATELLSAPLAGVVQQVLFACVFAGGYLRGFRFVVRAASALPALGVPPFRIWHDLSRFCRDGPCGTPQLLVY